MMTDHAACSPQELWAAAERFTAWLERTGYDSYDPYDFWGTWYGKFARGLYYRKNPVGVLLTAPFVFLEMAYPGYRKLLVKKRRYPTADAQLGLAFLNLYEAEKGWQPESHSRAGARHGHPAAHWLAKAKGLAADLLKQSASGYKGYCWGYPFDWRHVNGFMPKGTPHVTATPYCYELFAKLYDLTGDQEYLRITRSIAAFVAGDLKDTPSGADGAASSYTPFDEGKVVNASAYRAFVLVDAAARFGNQSYFEKAWRNVRFILQSQNADGSWLYAIDNPAEAFIDNFHTCFVLKNLYKLNLRQHDVLVQQAILRGYQWYRKTLFDEENNPKTYAIAPRAEIVSLEMYNVAEAISLGVLFRNEVPEAFALAEMLAKRLIGAYQLPAGHWITRVYRGGISHKLPFLRWPQSQLFLALTNLLACKSIESKTADEAVEAAG